MKTLLTSYEYQIPQQQMVSSNQVVYQDTNAVIREALQDYLCVYQREILESHYMQ